MKLTDDQQRTVLERYRRWLLKVAGEMAAAQGWWRWSERHDLAQEGWIAMWRALRTFDPSRGAEATYLTTAARLRMAECLKRETWTGTPMVRGHHREKPASPVERMVEPGTQFTLIEDADWAYHRQQIMHALALVSPGDRAYVVHCLLNDGACELPNGRRLMLSRRGRDTLRDRLASLCADRP